MTLKVNTSLHSLSYVPSLPHPEFRWYILYRHHLGIQGGAHHRSPFKKELAVELQEAEKADSLQLQNIQEWPQLLRHSHALPSWESPVSGLAG